MERDRRQRISDLYNAALERQPGERTAFLKEACHGDEGLRQEVESLLGYEPASARFLETPAVRMTSRADAAAPSNTEMVGRQLGPYKILAPLGAGETGGASGDSVSLAELDTEGVTATFICANAQTYPFAGKLRPDRVAIRRDGSSQELVGN